MIAEALPPPTTTLVWGAADWLAVSACLAGLLLLLLIVGYWRAGAAAWVRTVAGTLKLVAILILAICLLEPLFATKRASPGANQFAMLADNSQSMTLKDMGDISRGEQLKKMAGDNLPWTTQLARDFELRQFSFDSQLHAVDNFDALAFDGRSSDLGAALDRLMNRYQGRPLAGVLLFTDGSATDSAAVDRFLARAANPDAHVPPIYPVLTGRATSGRDIALQRVAVSQTNFEDAPVTLTAEMVTTNLRGRTITATLFDEADNRVGQEKTTVSADGQPLAVRFRIRPEKPGVSFYRVTAALDLPAGQSEAGENDREVTLVNNTRMVTVDRPKGPYRVLYVSGRPSWEYKFLNRAVASDDQVQLVGLIRVAKREPKFNFLGKAGDSANPLFRGFDEKDRDTTETFDQPVLIRMNTADQQELAGGFPKTADELFGYHAIVIDRLEAEFFTQDQMQLIKDFVRQRGGGLLMLGGEESFHNGKYDRTPIGDLLPVYADQVPDSPPEARYRLQLSREGWLEPWLRLHPEEDADRARFAAMPAFSVINQVRGIKPGATVLARALVEIDPSSGAIPGIGQLDLPFSGGAPQRAAAGAGGAGPAMASVPALVEQRFGQGRAAALLIGDLWAWEMHRPAPTDTDMEKAWRQTIRWLVGDVPQRVDVAVETNHEATDAGGAEGSVTVQVRVRDKAYLPLDNAGVTVRITAPDKTAVDLRAEPSARQPGTYEALYVPRQPGAYRAAVTAAAPDGSDILPPGETVAAGWTSDPAAEEFQQLQPDVGLLDRIAHATGGELVNAADLEKFAAGLPARHAEIMETHVDPFWHQSWVFLLAIGCLAAEWGLRRLKGLP